MVGALNVGNIHNIGVRLRLGLLKYVKITKEAPTTKARIVGLLNVFTIDDVQVTIDFKRSQETAALENSIALP